MAYESRFSEVSHDLEQSGFTSDITTRVSSPAPQYQAREHETSVSESSAAPDAKAQVQRPSSPQEGKITFIATHNYESYPEVVPQRQNSNDAMEHVVETEESHKMLRESSPQHTMDRSPDCHDVINKEDQTKQSHGRRRICGLPWLWFCIGLALLIITIGLAVGLGVGLTVDFVGGAVNPKYYSKSGTFNGSGIALASVNFGIDDSLYLFYQQNTGEIQQMIIQANGDWSFVTTVATNARNATPLSAVAYIVDSVATWHLFYIDNQNFVQQRTRSNASSFQTNIWQNGPIDILNLQAYGQPGELVGIQACYWGDFYGSRTVFNNGFNRSSTTPKTGMNVWYPSNNNTFEQYAWTTGATQWNKSTSWPNMNVHAGVACQFWESGTTSYVMMVDNSDTLNIFWKDIDLNLTSTETHPIDKWTNTSVAVNNVHHTTSLGYTDYVSYQASDLTLHGVNVSWAAENTTFVKAPDASLDVVVAAAEDPSLPGIDAFAIGSTDAGIAGTHLAITGLQDNLGSGGRSLALFFQNQGNDVTLATRPLIAGGWGFSPVPLVGATSSNESTTGGQEF